MAGGAGGEVVQFSRQFFRRPGHQGEAVGVVVAARAEGVGEGGQQGRVTIALLMFGHPSAQPGGGGLQSGLGPCGEDGWPCPFLGHGGGGCWRGDWWFGQDDVGIGSAESERINADDAAAVVSRKFRKCFQTGGNPEFQRREILVHALNCDDAQAMIDEMKNRYEAPLMQIFGQQARTGSAA